MLETSLLSIRIKVLTFYVIYLSNNQEHNMMTESTFKEFVQFEINFRSFPINPPLDLFEVIDVLKFQRAL